jgi:dGTPase
VRKLYPELAGRRLIHETVRRMINSQIVDLCDQSSHNIHNAAPQNIDEVRRQKPMIAFSEPMQQEQRELKQFLRTNLYRHYRVMRMSSKANRIIRELFDAFMGDVALLPDEFQIRAKDDKARAIADYIAGMTDRYAILEHRRLFSIEDQPL